tara:strand:- start:63 stop:521 length:459 start_codon:yes stop_codon:yes gene_type:complete
MENVNKMLDEYTLKSGYGLTGHNANVNTKDDFLRCPKCDSSELTMDTTSMSHGIVHDKNGIISEFTCNSCKTQLTLGLFNYDVGLPQLTARINWMEKYAPYVPTAYDKLQKYSLTGYSKKLKQHGDKYDLWDVDIGSKDNVPFDPKEYATEK